MCAYNMFVHLIQYSQCCVIYFSIISSMKAFFSIPFSLICWLFVALTLIKKHYRGEGKLGGTDKCALVVHLLQVGSLTMTCIHLLFYHFICQRKYNKELMVWIEARSLQQLTLGPTAFAHTFSLCSLSLCIECSLKCV